MTQAPTAHEERPRRPGPTALRRWAAPVAGALLPIVLALGVGALILLVLGADPGAFYYNIIRRGLLSWIGLQDTITRCAPLLLLGARSDRRLPRRPLEPRCRRAVPARRSDRRRARAGSRHGAAGLAGAAPGDGRGDGRGRRLVSGAGGAQGLPRRQRDRDHADDEFLGHQRGRTSSSSCPSTIPPPPCRRPRPSRPTTGCPDSSAPPSMSG